MKLETTLEDIHEMLNCEDSYFKVTKAADGLILETFDGTKIRLTIGML